MLRPPRPRGEALLTGELVWIIVLVSCLFAAFVFGIYNYAINEGYSIELARIMAVNTLVVLEIFNLFFIRNLYSTSLSWQMMKGTKVMWAVIVTIIIAQLLFTYFPPMQALFQTEGLPLHYGAILIGCGMLLFVILECEKQIRLRLTRKSRYENHERAA